MKPHREVSKISELTLPVFKKSKCKYKKLSIINCNVIWGITFFSKHNWEFSNPSLYSYICYQSVLSVCFGLWELITKVQPITNEHLEQQKYQKGKLYQINMCRQVKFEQHTAWKQINKHINFLKDLLLDSQEIDGIEGVTTHEIIEIFSSNMLLSLRNMQKLWTKIFCQYTLTDFYMIGILAKNGLTTFVFRSAIKKNT